MDKVLLRKTYDYLTKIIREGAYINVVLSDLKNTEDRALITKIVYGVVERYYELNQVISSLCPKSPKPAIKVILMQAIYAIKYLEIPNYAIVNASVDLTQDVGKKELKGFVNAVLKKATKGEYTLPTDEKSIMEAKYNLPYALIKAVINDCGENAESVLTPPRDTFEHIRISSQANQQEVLRSIGSYRESKEGGYFTKNSDIVKMLFDKGMLTFQSPSSMFTVHALGDVSGKTVLELCSAPGGKAVYIAERGGLVTACDIHSIRVKLIEKYATRMGVKLKAQVNDAKVERKEWLNKFDIVTVDAPCSGIGVIAKRPDIALTFDSKEYQKLISEQRAILKQGAKYVKRGGVLLYSTCTVLSAENQVAIRDFLLKNSDFSIEPFDGAESGEITLYPNDNYDGFYVAKMRRK
ncbi:MAG: hypothetical protein IJY07_03630 [Clostridia bacterium]|nr:hypothetical protein [Clostridia bacterium]